MSWTKRQLVEQAFDEIGLAAYVYDLQPEQLESALRSMDAMVAGWNTNGIRINYPLKDNPNNSDLDEDSGVPDFCIEAIYLGLACRLAPRYGKVVAIETKQYADMAYNNMANQLTELPHERQLPRTMPRGQGTKPWRNFNNPFVYAPTTDDILAGGDGPIEFE